MLKFEHRWKRICEMYPRPRFQICKCAAVRDTTLTALCVGIIFIDENEDRDDIV